MSLIVAAFVIGLPAVGLVVQTILGHGPFRSSASVAVHDTTTFQAQGSAGHSSSTTSTSSFAAPTTSASLVSSGSITWTWSDDQHSGTSDAKIYIGTSAGGTDVANGTDVGSSQSYTKTGLGDGTYYAYVVDTTVTNVTAGDFVVGTNTNTATSGNSSGTTVDTTAPTFSNLNATASGTSITVTWTTNEPATTKLSTEVGLSLPAEDTNRTTSHSMTVSGLSAGTRYTFNAQGTDAAGNSGSSSTTVSATTAAANSNSGSSTSSSSSASTNTTTQSISSGSASSDSTATSTAPATTPTTSVSATAAVPADKPAASAPASTATPTNQTATIQTAAPVVVGTAPSLTAWQQFAIAYSLIGALLAALVSLLHWGLPYLANTPTEGVTEAIARRIHRIQATARGFAWLAYPLVAFGTVMEWTLVLAKLDGVAKHETLLALYAALWCLQILFWLKRPIVGKVSTPRQQPVSLTVVRLFHAGTNKIYATLATEKDGRFGFHVHTGTYDLKAGKAGYSATTATESVGRKDSLRANLVLTPSTPEPTLTKPNPTGGSFWDLAAKTPPKLVEKQ